MPDARPPDFAPVAKPPDAAPEADAYALNGRGAALQVLRGLLMGAADVVPGVSGGTVALAVGIYQPLLAAINRCVDVATAALRLDARGLVAALGRVPWLWLISLGLGVGVAIFTLAGTIRHALLTWPQAMAGLFTGLILGATLLAWRMLRRHTAGTWAMLAVSAVGFFFFLGLNPVMQGNAAASYPWWVFMGAGAIAICAMILPGISGSFLLVLMGMYAPVLEAVSALRLGVLLPFALGCALGLALSSRGLHWLLKHHHDLLMACMTGLMLGSLRVLWPWPDGLGSTAMAWPATGQALVPTLLALAGLALVLGVDALASRLGRA